MSFDFERMSYLLQRMTFHFQRMMFGISLWLRVFLRLFSWLVFLLPLFFLLFVFI